MNNIFVTGFYGTGSSAVIDLLSEFDGVDVALGRRYEHCLFLGQSCLLDMYQRLFGPVSNRMIQDRAINDFIDEMKRQNNYDFGWYGSYKKLFGTKFFDAVTEFVNSISVESNDSGIAHAKGVRFSFVHAVLQIGAAILKGYKITKLGRKYLYDNRQMRYLTATENEFIASARKFIDTYFELCEKEETEIYDHILLPEQCGAMKNIFTNEKLIIVDRDPRDIYLSSYYVWNTVRCGRQRPPFPDGIDAFCKMWKSVHTKTYENADCTRVKIVKFEDLIYDYDRSVKEIAEFCELDEKAHKRKKETFNPADSIKNTQVFLKSDEFGEETEILENNLSEYLYKFPYKTETSIDEVVDI